MKKIVQKEVHVCDKCGKETYPDPCLGCGTEVCYECQPKHGKNYRHSVYFQGSGDGFYCSPCDTKLTEGGTDARHNAYCAVKSLKDELEAWHTDFKRRQEKAEDALKSLRP